MEVLAGVDPNEVEVRPLKPYDDLICDFLNEWSKALRENASAKRLGDVAAFAFYCRRANLNRLKEEAGLSDDRIGRGLCFHIAPSNIPVNFAFTFIFGLIAGNSNIVRVSNKSFQQVDVLCDTLNRVFEDKRFDRIRRMTSLVRYDHSKEITDKLSSMCDIRIIWGGDETIRTIRESLISPRTTEITFSDRYSVACLSGKAVGNLTDEELNKLVNAFYNDTYLMDQNACSSPQMVYWLDATDEDKERFWNAVLKTLDEYEMSEFTASEKYTMVCNDAISQDGKGRLKSYGDNRLCVISMPSDYRGRVQDSCFGKYGLFCEQTISDLGEMLGSVDPKVQTCTYFGIDPKEISDRIIRSGVTGVDRIVPIGNALDIGVFWDGYDLVRHMSRRVEVV